MYIHIYIYVYILIYYYLKKKRDIYIYIYSFMYGKRYMFSRAGLTTRLSVYGTFKRFVLPSRVTVLSNCFV